MTLKVIAAQLRWPFALAMIPFALVAQASAQATFTPLGTFGGVQSKATDVSADGSVVVGTVLAPANSSSVFRWTKDETMLRGADASSGAAISADGSTIVGTYQSMNGLEAFRWTIDGTFEGLGDLSGGNFQSKAFDVSADDNAVVGFGTNATDGEEPFLWTAQAGMVGLGHLPGGTRSGATGISADGTVVVGTSQGTGQQAFRWTAQTGMIGLGRLPGAAFSLANGVSDDGKVIVGYNTFPGPIIPIHYEAFRWTENEGMISLGDFPGGRIESVARAVSEDGSVIVGTAVPDEGSIGTIGTAFYWTAETGMVSLQQLLTSAGADLDGFLLTEATGVSAGGLTIVGTAFRDGQQQAFVATIPEPSTVVLALFAALVLFALYLRRRFAAAGTRQ
jgi:probable HAF family extracellular repeat protein